MGSNKCGSDRTASNIERKRYDIGDCRSILEEGVLHTLQHDDNIARSGQLISGTHLQGTRITEEGYLRQRVTIRIRIYERDLPTTRDRSKPFNGLSSPDRRTNGTGKS